MKLGIPREMGIKWTAVMGGKMFYPHLNPPNFSSYWRVCVFAHARMTHDASTTVLWHGILVRDHAMGGCHSASQQDLLPGSLKRWIIIPICEPWCWNIYQPVAQKSPSYVNNLPGASKTLKRVGKSINLFCFSRKKHGFWKKRIYFVLCGCSMIITHLLKSGTAVSNFCFKHI